MPAKFQNRGEVFSRYKIPTTVTVQVDSREKYPVLFPSHVLIPHPEKSYRRLWVGVKVEKKRLLTGDYRLAEYPGCCVVERKAAQLELFKNMVDSLDAVRQAKAFRRLSACEYPYLLIEASPAELLQPSRIVEDPEALVHTLTLVLAKYGFRVLWIPWKRHRSSARRTLGTFLVHLMLSCALRKTMDILPQLLEEGEDDEGEEEEGGGDAPA